MPRPTFAIAFVALLLAATPAHAHKLKAFATAVGAKIEGSTYFVGGGPARGASIRVETSEGAPPLTLQADDEGRFGFAATVRADQVIEVDAGDGHSARFVIPAADLPESLPESLPAPSGTAGGPETAPTILVTAAGAAAGPESEPPGPASTAAAGVAASAAVGTPLEELVEEAIARQLRPLREQINEMEDQTRLHDVLGGIGYIVGLAGLTMAFRSRRRPEPRAEAFRRSAPEPRP